MDFGKISLLVGSIAASVFSPNGKDQNYNHALFFIGNGAYYALNAQDSLNNPHTKDPYATYGEFISKFKPDSILMDFVRALHEKEQNIFINEKIWNSFVHAKKRAEQLFAEISIHNPLEQIYIDNTTVLPTTLSNDLEAHFILPNKGAQSLDLQKAPRTTRWYHPVFLTSCDTLTLKSLPIKQRLENFKKNASILHPDFHKIFHFLYIFNPAEWDIYNTGYGLYYITPKNRNHAGINTQNFIKLNCAETVEHGLPVTSREQELLWTQELEKIFTTNKTIWRIYISGHGSNLITSPEGLTEEYCTTNEQSTLCTRAQIAGLPSTNFKQLMQFLNKKITVERLIVSSCYTPAHRLLQLLPGPNNFDVITPVSEFIPLQSHASIVCTSQYVPAWLTATNTQQLEYSVLSSGDKKSTPIMHIKKFSALLDTKVSAELVSYLRNLYDPTDNGEPTILRAGKQIVEKLQ